MTEDQKKELIQEVTNTVRVVVNGKVDDMHKKLDSYISEDLKWKGEVNTFMEELLPVRDGLITVQLINKFVKWLGLPAIGAFIMWILFNK